MSREKCLWVTGVISSYLMGKPIKYDITAFIEEVVEKVEGGYRCRLCGKVTKLNTLISHLRRKHCSQVVEAWNRVKPRALFNVPGGRTVFMKIAIQCRGCSYIALLEVPSNAGPPNLRELLEKLQRMRILRRCPRCKRPFHVQELEVKFVSEREVLGKAP